MRAVLIHSHTAMSTIAQTSDSGHRVHHYVNSVSTEWILIIRFESSQQFNTLCSQQALSWDLVDYLDNRLYSKNSADNQCPNWLLSTQRNRFITRLFLSRSVVSIWPNYLWKGQTHNWVLSATPQIRYPSLFVHLMQILSAVVLMNYRSWMQGICSRASINTVKWGNLEQPFNFKHTGRHCTASIPGLFSLVSASSERLKFVHTVYVCQCVLSYTWLFQDTPVEGTSWTQNHLISASDIIGHLNSYPTITVSKWATKWQLVGHAPFVFSTTDFDFSSSPFSTAIRECKHL